MNTRKMQDSALKLPKDPPRVLAIAGSDSGGGAGIQADLKTITALGAYGACAITALTAQNTCGVEDVSSVSPVFIKAQIRAVAEDIGADAVKTGMLLNAQIVEVVAEAIPEFGLGGAVVIDPVITATSGDRLFEEGGGSVLQKALFPLAKVVTPNLPEAGVLCDREVRNTEDMREAARTISDLGPAWTVIKGGHLPGSPKINLAFDGWDFYEFEYEAIDTRNTHGTGCTFSSAIATFLGYGMGELKAVELAGEAVHNALLHPLSLGGGSGPVNHAAIAKWFS